MNSFSCFGEVLWDVFPDQEIIGGAPLNVALRLFSFNNNVSIISAIGNDVLGEKLKNYLKENNLSINNLQQNEYNTGCVNVTLNTKGSASYEIKSPAAWDYIKATPEAIESVKNSDMFIFGSLACRNKTSKNSLITLLNHSKISVFDVNLRSPFYSIQLLCELMHYADFIKFNDEEINLICSSLNSGFSSIEDNMNYILETYNAKTICVTLGENGAILLYDNTYYKSNGYKVKVKDTVGAGDSFLATLLHNIVETNNIKSALETACAVGALVASKRGANPKVSEKEIQEILE